MFAFAVTVLSSRAVSLAASATPLSNDDFDNLTENSNEQNTSKNSDYRKINQNVYIASEQAQAVKNFNNSLQLTRNYAVYAEKLNLTVNQHVEGNVCVNETSGLDVFNSGIVVICKIILCFLKHHIDCKKCKCNNNNNRHNNRYHNNGNLAAVTLFIFLFSRRF